MHNNQNERSEAFMNTVIKPNKNLDPQSLESMRNRQRLQQMHLRNQQHDEQMQYLEYLGDYDEPKTESHARTYNSNLRYNQYQQYANRAPTVGGGGGGDYNMIHTNDNYHQAESVQHKKSQNDLTPKGSNETFYRRSVSDCSESTRQTVLKKRIPNGKELMNLVGSQASLQKVISEGITGTHAGDRAHAGAAAGTSLNKRSITSREQTVVNLSKNRNRKTPNTKLCCIDSEGDLACSATQSAELINDKIIHPMVKKFRLLYLHNIKEEVGIIEDLEKLPNEVVKFCKAIEEKSRNL